MMADWMSVGLRDLSFASDLRKTERESVGGGAGEDGCKLVSECVCMCV